MDLKKLKNTIAAIEGAESNIEHWNKLRNRELVVIPVDSEYYKEFKIWKKQKGACYNGEKECSPIYISPSKSEPIVDLMIKHQEDFRQPFLDILCCYPAEKEESSIDLPEFTERV